MLHSTRIYAFLFGWLADRLLGDPVQIPHPIVWFGNLIHKGEKIYNKGNNRQISGMLFTICTLLLTFGCTQMILSILDFFSNNLSSLITAIGVFFCLAGKTLIQEVKNVFNAIEKSTEKGRIQLARIVGRDTKDLNNQEIKIAALETLSENLSDGVIAPMFWFALLGLPGIFTYKMLNTMDSMIGYKNERYKEFGATAARLDDVANYIPARLTAFFMLLVSWRLDLIPFVLHYGKAHASPNSGFPESALAGILNCRFGGTHNYFGKPVEKPYIGNHDKEITTKDLNIAIGINNKTELLMGFIVMAWIYFNLSFI